MPKPLRSTEGHRSPNDQTRVGPNLIERGFTLVELLIVIVLLGILAGIVVFAVGNLTSNAKTTGCAAEKTTISDALEAYKAQTGSYPAAMSSLTSGALAELKTTPANYQIDGSGNISAISGNAGGCA